MKLKEDKCKLLLCEKTTSYVYNGSPIMVGTEIIKNSSNEKLLEITVDNKLIFEDHVSNLCGKARQKLNLSKAGFPLATFFVRRIRSYFSF